MSKKVWLVALLVLATGPLVKAQEPEADEAPSEPRRQIRVLENPYDIASFYRSSQSGPGYFSYHAPYEFDSQSRYAIAGYYRQGGTNPRGYGRFWNSESASGRRGGMRLVGGRRRSAGCRGELFMVAPTILGGVMPLGGGCR